MAFYRFRGALISAEFPLLSIFRSRSVITPGYDNNTRGATTNPSPSSGESADNTMAECIYCENVVPTSEGIQSVNYSQVIAPVPGETLFDQVIILRDQNETNYLFSPANGKNYIYSNATSSWTSTNPIAYTTAVVSHAYVNGRTFICYAGLGIWEYDGVANTFLPQTVTGTTVDQIQGICGSSNYLITFGGSGNLTISWSSLANPLDFAPSLLTGAGFSIPQDIRGQVIGIAPTIGGIFVYTTRNIIAGIYTNNAIAPFNFKEVGSSGGINTAGQITIDHNSGPQYAWTTSGLQLITAQSATSPRPEINDFLAGRIWETWDPVAKQLVQQNSGLIEFAVKVTLITNRYLIISYNPVLFSGTYSYALVYDLQIHRWGKLKIDHVDCFYFSLAEFSFPYSYTDLMETPYYAVYAIPYTGLNTLSASSGQYSKNTVAFLSPDGTVKLMEMSYNKSSVEQGVAIFGKFQVSRARTMQLQQLDLEGTYTNPTDGSEINTVTALASFDGYSLSKQSAMQLIRRSGKYAKYAKRLVGTNLAFAIEGTFALNAYILEVSLDGDR